MSNWLRWSLEKLQADKPPETNRDSATPSVLAAASNRPDEGDEAASTSAVNEPEAAPSTPTQDNETSQVDELKAMFAQTLEMFQGLMQVQMQLSAPRTASGGSAKQAATSERTSPTEQYWTPASAAASPTPTQPRKTRSRRSKSPETQAETAALTQQILDAIADIERYNRYIDKTGQPHRLKREITTNFLKALTPNQRLINRILDGQQAHLEHHHQQMHIQPGHNSSYRERITLADIQQTLQASDHSPQD